MQAEYSNRKLSEKELKQVKVDNWGTFFLQRLLQLYFNKDLLDLTLKFPAADINLKVHRLVVTACTDYFMNLESKEENNKNEILMPPDMPYECVKSIVSFMYTGQLEYWSTEKFSLYYTAQKMNMTILTKLLDAQVNTNEINNQILCDLEGSESNQQLFKKSVISSDLSHCKRDKLPASKRKLIKDENTNLQSRIFYQSFSDQKQEWLSGPSRFDLPEAEKITLGIFSSFEDITYNTAPITQALENINSLDSTKNYNQENLMLSNKNDANLSEENDWLNCLPTNKINFSKDISVDKTFNFEEKENLKESLKKKSNEKDYLLSPINNHEKIIKEVLKKYPHLLKNNKNIRLKIMQKVPKKSTSKTKTSYVIFKSDNLMVDNCPDEVNLSGSKFNNHGPWKCHKCDLNPEYVNYYLYRRHMMDVHEEKFDPKICEYCGFKATKRNILLYHMFTKHNISPPKNISFPKCDECSYVALSESLLKRHKVARKHSLNNDPYESIQCSECTQVFKDVTDLAEHEIITKHGLLLNKKKYYCEYCKKCFLQLYNLKLHIKEVHQTNNLKILIHNETGSPFNKAFNKKSCKNNFPSTSEIHINSTSKADNEFSSYVDKIVNNEISSRTLMSFDNEVKYRCKIDNESIVNKLSASNEDINTVVYIENDNFQESDKSYLPLFNCSDHSYTDEIVEEVFEEFEEIDNEIPILTYCEERRINDAVSGNKNTNSCNLQERTEKIMNLYEGSLQLI